MFSRPERLILKTSKDGVGRYDFLKQLMNEFQTTKSLRKLLAYVQKKNFRQCLRIISILGSDFSYLLMCFRCQTTGDCQFSEFCL